MALYGWRMSNMETVSPDHVVCAYRNIYNITISGYGALTELRKDLYGESSTNIVLELLYDLYSPHTCFRSLNITVLSGFSLRLVCVIVHRDWSCTILIVPDFHLSEVLHTDWLHTIEVICEWHLTQTNNSLCSKRSFIFLDRLSNTGWILWLQKTQMSSIRMITQKLVLKFQLMK